MISLCCVASADLDCGVDILGEWHCGIQLGIVESDCNFCCKAVVGRLGNSGLVENGVHFDRRLDARSKVEVFQLLKFQ